MSRRCDREWVALDAGFSDHPKFLAAGPIAGVLAIAAIGWSSRNRTDGFIPRQMPRRLIDVDDPMIAPGVDAEDVARRLVDVGLWESAEGGWIVHDFLDWQRSAEDIEAIRAKRAEAGRSGGLAKAKQVAKQNRSPSVSDSVGASSSAVDTTNNSNDPSRAPAREAEGGSKVRKPSNLTYRGKRVSDATVDKAHRAFAAYLSAAGRQMGERTGDGRPSEAFKQVIGAVLEHPHVEPEDWERQIFAFVASPPDWVSSSPPQVGHVFGSRAVQWMLDPGERATRPDKANANLRGYHEWFEELRAEEEAHDRT